jgi:hypothetical protein
MWQALETNDRFIAQEMTGESAVRRADDVGCEALSYAEVKAIASGNPAVLTLAEADAEIQRLPVMKKNHADEQYLARRNVRELPQTWPTPAADGPSAAACSAAAGSTWPSGQSGRMKGVIIHNRDVESEPSVLSPVAYLPLEMSKSSVVMRYLG